VEPKKEGVKMVDSDGKNYTINATCVNCLHKDTYTVPLGTSIHEITCKNCGCEDLVATS
jgi:transcription elongation factor Elf1